MESEIKTVLNSLSRQVPKSTSFKMAKFNLALWSKSHGIINQGDAGEKDLSKKDLSEESFKKGDLVECNSVGAFDRFLKEGTIYEVIKNLEDSIVIKDDSGTENPYLKVRFRRVAKNLI